MRSYLTRAASDDLPVRPGQEVCHVSPTDPSGYPGPRAQRKRRRSAAAERAVTGRYIFADQGYVAEQPTRAKQRLIASPKNPDACAARSARRGCHAAADPEKYGQDVRRVRTAPPGPAEPARPKVSRSAGRTTTAGNAACAERGFDKKRCGRGTGRSLNHRVRAQHQRLTISQSLRRLRADEMMQ